MTPMYSDPDDAPAMVGNEPPDRVSMSLSDHLKAALDYLRNGLTNGTLTPQDMMELQAFEQAKIQIIQEAQAQQGGGEQGQGEMANAPSTAMNGPEVPYGQSPGDMPMSGMAGV